MDLRIELNGGASLARAVGLPARAWIKAVRSISYLLPKVRCRVLTRIDESTS